MASFRRSLKFARRGFVLAVKRDRHVRYHLLSAGLVMLCALLGRIEVWAWVCLILCCGLVISAEFLNSALETLCDRVQPRIDPYIRDCKDIAAGGVLVCSVLSVAVGAVIFLRPAVLLELSRHKFELGTLILLSPFLFYLLKGRNT